MEKLKASCPGCRGTGDAGGNPLYGACDDCDGKGWIYTTPKVVDVPDIKLIIVDFLENRDGDMGVISTDEERGASANKLHDAVMLVVSALHPAPMSAL